MSGGVGRGRAPQKKEHQNPAQAQNVTSNSSGTLQAGLMPLMARYFRIKLLASSFQRFREDCKYLV